MSTEEKKIKELTEEDLEQVNGGTLRAKAVASVEGVELTAVRHYAGMNQEATYIVDKRADIEAKQE